MTHYKEYKEPSTSEVLEEKKKLEQLKVRSQQESLAWWEWDVESQRFSVSSEWERLTGYDARSIFPVLSRNAEIEDIIPSFSNTWLSLIAPSDRDEAETAINQFIRHNHQNAFLEHGYRFRCKDGTIKTLLTTARTLWRGDNLQQIFVQTRDIGKWNKPIEVAKAIESSKDDQKTFNAKLKNLTKKVEASKSVFPIIQSLVVGLSALIVSVMAAGEPIIKMLSKWRRLEFNPPEISKGVPVANEEFLSEIDSETFAALESMLQRLALEGQSAVLGLYSPSSVSGNFFPYRYAYFLRASSTGEGVLDNSQKDVHAHSDTDRRAAAHVARTSHTYQDGDFYKTSFPFAVEEPGADGRSRLFFVELETKSPPTESQKRSVQLAARDAVIIFDKSYEKTRN
mgnify:CR=1 FL=1